MVACTSRLCSGAWWQVGSTGAEVQCIACFCLLRLCSLVASACTHGTALHSHCLATACMTLLCLDLAAEAMFDGTVVCGLLRCAVQCNALVVCACNREGGCSQSVVRWKWCLVVFLSSLHRAGMLVFARCLLVAVRGSASTAGSHCTSSSRQLVPSHYVRLLLSKTAVCLLHLCIWTLCRYGSSSRVCIVVHWCSRHAVVVLWCWSTSRRSVLAWISMRVCCNCATHTSPCLLDHLAGSPVLRPATQLVLHTLCGASACLWSSGW